MNWTRKMCRLPCGRLSPPVLLSFFRRSFAFLLEKQKKCKRNTKEVPKNGGPQFGGNGALQGKKTAFFVGVKLKKFKMHLLLFQLITCRWIWKKC